MIKNLDKKLKGELPVTKSDLFTLVSSWGRKHSFYSNINNLFVENESIYISEQEPNECYNLSNLDVSKIQNLSEIFKASYYNGDLSKWNVSSCINMKSLFSDADFNNDSISNWNTSYVQNLSFCFSYSKFNRDLSKWNVSKCLTLESCFEESDFNNDSLKNWDISSCLTMVDLFYYSLFNGDISNWNPLSCVNFRRTFESSLFDGDISKWNFNPKADVQDMFYGNENFKNKYNNGTNISSDTQRFLDWFEANKNKMASLNITKEELVDIDDYLDNFDIKELTNGN